MNGVIASHYYTQLTVVHCSAKLCLLAYCVNNNNVVSTLGSSLSKSPRTKIPFTTLADWSACIVLSFGRERNYIVTM